MKLIAAIVLGLVIAGCGGESSPTAPSASTPPPPAPAPPPARVALTGTVTYTGTQVGLSGVTVRIVDGVNAGRLAVTGADGTYRLDDLAVGNGNVQTEGPTGWEHTSAGVFINGTNTLNFAIRTVNPWTARGTGNDVFQMPAYVTRTRITGQLSTNLFCQNFIVRIAGRGFVNEILGSCSVNTSGFTYVGVHATSGGTVEVTNSNNVFWTFAEQR